MTFNISVSNGTNAGWRRIKEPIKPWTCECGRLNKYSRACLDCGRDAVV